ncbi:cytochrome c551 [Psychrobacillus sp. FSL H8-0483]|uniref:cytochrome c551 n=1 Tax=Psychrobacillus sp. FSL H8-0483 TaxID=2921389 RepID=UPI00315B219F
MNKKLLAVIFGTGLILAACGGNKEAEPAEPSNGTTTENVKVDAEKIVTSKCISCHGGNLEGQGNFPSLADVGARLSQDEILNVIENGRNAMPAGIITGEEAQAVAAWLAAKK